MPFEARSNNISSITSIISEPNRRLVKKFVEAVFFTTFGLSKDRAAFARCAPAEAENFLVGKRFQSCGCGR